MRYHVLKTGTSLRNFGVCLALLAGSYLASGLINSSPVIQPELTSGRRPAVIITPSPAGVDVPVGDPSSRREADFAPNPNAVHSL